MDPPALGIAHPGFFYPDPLGFWAEVRRWSVHLVRRAWPHAQMAGALSVTAVMHADEPAPLVTAARTSMRPRVVLFLDERAWTGAGIVVSHPQPYAMTDPFREGQAYEGFWATLDDGTVVGKSPQHPAAHKLYRAADIDGFLAAAPIVTT